MLTAGEVDPEQQLPIALTTERIIETATDHANALGVGYSELITHGQAWVLSRLAIEFTARPTINEHYALTTWVEAANKHFSQRNFEITGNDGRPLGYARTIWVAINIASRSAADISRLAILSEVAHARPCPIAPVGRIRPTGEPTRRSTYTFRYTDIDFNRHVNSVRYIDLILNQWPLEFHDRYAITRIEVTYQSEAHYGQNVDVLIYEDGNDATCCIESPQGTVCSMKLHFAERK
jgi:acyl-ACP thioesterase